MESCIKRITFANFRNQGDLIWELQPDVNVLVGANGRGKSTLIRLLNIALQHPKTHELSPEDAIAFEDVGAGSLEILFNNDDFIEISEGQQVVQSKISFPIIDFIQTFDVVSEGNLLDKILRSLIYEDFPQFEAKLFRSFLDAQSDENLRKEVEATREARGAFLRIVNEIFGDTNKYFDDKIEKETSPIVVKDTGDRVPLDKLSSGEKQMLILLLTALLQNRRPTIFFLDEPEISLHIEWQRRLINDLRIINDKAQLIIVTHSHTIFFREWGSRMQRMGELFSSFADTETENHDTITGVKKVDIAAELPTAAVADESEFLRVFREKAIKTTTYHANQFINNYDILTIIEGNILLRAFEEAGISPDFYTFYLVAERIRKFEDIQVWVERMLTYDMQPDTRIYNALLKRARWFHVAYNLMQKMKEENIIPDIFSISFLLTKATNKAQVEETESLRMYYKIPINQHYRTKLAAKLSSFNS